MATTPKKVTVSELKTFIEAVEFAADTDEWIPSKRQWLRIREMIDSLVESSSAPSSPQQVVTLPSAYSGPTQMAPGGLSTVGLTPPGPVQIPQGVPMSANPAQAVRTPDIDTSRGSYQSSFA